MFEIAQKQTGVEWFAFGQDEIITFTKGKLNKPLENLDLNNYLKCGSNDIKMSQYGSNLLFQESAGDAVLYNLKKKEVIFSTVDQPAYFNAGFADLSAAGYIRVEQRQNGDFYMTQLIDISTGSVMKEFPRRIIRKSDGGKYIYEMPVGGGNITRVDFDGNSVWELVAESHDVKETGSDGSRPNKLAHIIGERNSQLWYQESSGVVKAVNIDTCELELTLGESDSDLPNGMKQSKNEQLWGTFSYRFSRDKQTIYGMGGRLYTEIDLSSSSPRRRVYDCSESSREFGASFNSVYPNHPEIDNKFMYPDNGAGFIGALDRDSKKVTWSLNLFPDGDAEKPFAGIRDLREHGDRLYVLVKPRPTDTNGTLITLGRI